MPARTPACFPTVLTKPAHLLHVALAALVIANAASAGADISNPPATQPLPAHETAPSDLDSLAINRGARSTAPATQATTQPAGKPAATSFEVGRVVMSLVAVIGLILFLKWGSKKVFVMPASGASSIMQVVSRTALAPRQQLLLVRVGRRLMVIGDSGGRLSGLGEIADPDEVASLIGQSHAASAAGGSAGSFKSVLRRFGAGRNQHEPGWEELQQESPDDRGDGAEWPRRVPRHPSTGGTEADKALEAARTDIQALRVKLRETTGRLTDP